MIASVVRDGWGVRHPLVDDLLAVSVPVASEDVEWAVPLTLTAYLGAPAVLLPSELVISVRCLAMAPEGIVVCTTRKGDSHAWPGGHRESGESYEETARREVHEETGWRLDPGSFHVIGWIHLHCRGAASPESTYPYPDTIWIVGTATTSIRDRFDGDEWIDPTGFEIAACVVPLAEARTKFVDALSAPFLDLLAAASA